MWKRLLVLVAVITAACGGPGVRVEAPEPEGPTFFPVVVDTDGEVGAGLSITADGDGNPHLAYLAFEGEEAAGGPPDPAAPTLPAVKHAHLVEQIWTRSVVADDVPVRPEDQTAIAVDGDGVHHVVWTARDGLYYSSNAEGEFSRPQRVAPGDLAGPSVSAANGTVRLAFYEGTGGEGPGALVRVATRNGGAWDVETAAEASAGDLPATGIGSAGDEVLVGYGSEGRTLLARSTDGVWESEVADDDGGFGVDLALDGAGNPHLAYYDGNGLVKHAHSVGGGPWEVSEAGDAGELPDAGAAAIALGEDGTHHVAWQNAGGGLGYATNAEGSFAAEDVPDTAGATLPAIAVGVEDTVNLAWHNAEEHMLQMSIRSDDRPLLAVPPPEDGGAAPPGQVPVPADCPDPATEMTIEAPPGAATSGFADDCLAAPAGEPFQIVFENADPNVPHNVAIYTDQTAEESLFVGETFPGEDSRTYEVDPIDEAGNLFFRCDVHPTTMTGTFVVE